MSTASKRVVTPEQRQRENRLMGTTLAFVALGPPIGFVTGLLLSAASEFVSGKYLDILLFPLAAFIGTIFFGLWLYLFGAIPAGIAGMLVAFLMISNRFSWWLVLLIGFGVGCLWFAQYFVFPWGGPPDTKLNLNLELGRVAAWHIIVCLVPTILCAAIVRHYERKWCRKPEPSPEMAHDH